MDESTTLDNYNPESNEDVPWEDFWHDGDEGEWDGEGVPAWTDPVEEPMDE